MKLAIGAAVSALTTLSLLTHALAAPTPAPDPALAVMAPSTSFNLKLASSDRRVDGKCASTYHTGAGFNDMVVGACDPAAPRSFALNPTDSSKIDYLGFGATTPSQVQAYDGLASYEVWAKVVANAGLSGTEFTYSESEGFLQKGTGLGFLACRWSHYNSWQLFALSREPDGFPLSCARVALKKSF
ncbi:uncharacterized protein B0I36DRAFT_380204 [Microdochium trichocladiopsis]|uniref:DUF7907 domain-containing protein n=1 Tax=Microdochium trichocladiopsis TaxID=1682393 RepID=A0A9P8YGT7_9PEZI|nr:uncharacterized protein B0I36DRAFT_380204 [Microdochium trichocladiopsis]KAH7041447.1 hypothetical protein B0I36DRAFT_380204 [Microdochium trichocladiopsis]